MDNEEFEHFSVNQLDRADTLIFGRNTFNGMASYWTSDDALTGSPRVAERMKGKPKIVISRMVSSTDWAPGTTLPASSRR